MDLYSKNLELLQEKAKSLYIKLKEEDPLYNYKVEEVEGQNNYIIQNDVSRCFLHSIYDVQREMKQLFREVESDVELLIIFGLGWGYSLSFIKNKFPDVKRVIFVEPFLDIFKRMSQKRNLRQLFQGIENINLILNEQPKTAAKQVTDLINEKVYEKFEICFHMSYRTLLSSYYEVFFNQLIKNIQNWKSNLATWVTQKSRWTVNTFNNVRKKHISAENILPSLKNLPVIIVSAGPSLERNMHLLSGVNDRALIVAVGSAIKILDTHDIQPHLRFAFDANSKNYNKILCDLNSYDIPLVYSDRIPPSALDKYRGKKVKMVINSNYIIHYIYDKIDKDYKIYKDGFTIANTVLSIFSELGAPEIILLGQDLCYTFDKLHAEGSWDDDREIDFSNNKFVKTTDIN
ncbi:MAG: motility associated factor glycosyltransferase family protein, partial [Bacillota bacterium]